RRDPGATAAVHGAAAPNLYRAGLVGGWNLVEDHSPVVVAEHLALHVVPHRPRQHQLLQVAALAHQVLHRVAVGDGGDVLGNDRPGVELAGDVMAGGADDLHAPRVGGVVGLGAREGRQEGVVDVDDPLRIV